MNERKNKRTNERTDERTNGRTNEQTDKRTEGRTNEQTDGRTNRAKIIGLIQWTRKIQKYSGINQTKFIYFIGQKPSETLV